MARKSKKPNLNDTIFSTVKLEIIGVNFEDAAGKTPASLKVKAAITHAGKVNLNHAFYSPVFMRDFVKSLTDPFPRPVLFNHDDNEASIGRVVSAEYVNLLTDDQKNVLLAAEVSTWVFAETQGDTPTCEIMPALISDAKKIMSLLSSADDYKGIGEVQAVLEIVDKEAIENILSDRYLTLSIGFKTDESFCSVHMLSAFGRGGCYCMRGDEVVIADESDGTDTVGEIVFYVTGAMEARDVSYVNTPADTHAINLSVVEQDSVLSENFEIIALPAQTSEEDLAKVVNDNIQNPEDVDLDELLTKEDACDTVYNFMDTELADAKLTTEKRKALPDSAFCGPGRSFPAPDCSHVTAARRLVGRFKGSDATKAKILACVNRRAKSLGCDSKDCFAYQYEKDAVQVSLVQLTTEADVKEAIAWLADQAKFAEMVLAHSLTDETVVAIKAAVKVAAEKFDLEMPVETVPVVEPVIEPVVTPDPVETPVANVEAELTELRAKYAQLDSEHTTLTKDYNDIYAQYAKLEEARGQFVDELIRVKKDAKNAFIDCILFLEKIAKPEMGDAIVRKEELTKRTLESLKDSLKDLQGTTSSLEQALENTDDEEETEENEKETLLNQDSERVQQIQKNLLLNSRGHLTRNQLQRMQMLIPRR